MLVYIITRHEPGSRNAFILCSCSPPRKSLVKGERFIRNDELQELTEVSCEISAVFIVITWKFNALLTNQEMQ
jgi:hypothetical protein